MAMDDPAVRAAVAAGDLTRLGDLRLDDEEQRMLCDAARGESEDPEVEGFGAFAPPYVPVSVNPPLMGAVRYAEDGLLPPPLRVEFNAWTARLGAQGTW
jgi:hypothetical protein